MPNRTSNILIKPISFSENDMISLNNHLSQLDWSMFLESASLDHIDSNWSIYAPIPLQP